MAKKNPWKKPAWLREKIAMDNSMRSEVEECDYFLSDMFPIKRGRLKRLAKKILRTLK